MTQDNKSIYLHTCASSIGGGGGGTAQAGMVVAPFQLPHPSAGTWSGSLDG